MPRNYPEGAKYGAGKRSGDSGLREDRAGPRSPDRHAAGKPRLPVPVAAGPAQPQDPEDAEHEEIRRASKAVLRFVVPRRSEAANQSPRTRPGRSPRLALFPYQARGVELNRYRLAGVKTAAQF